MKNSEKNDPAWKLLGAARRVEADPFFSRNVSREIRKLQASGEDREGVLTTILSFFRQPALVGAAAAVALLAVVFLSSKPVTSPIVSVSGSMTEFDPAEEIQSIEYLGELMATSDPSELDDAALAELYLIASR